MARLTARFWVDAYLARLRVDTDTEGALIEDEEIFRTIAVAY